MKTKLCRPVLVECERRSDLVLNNNILTFPKPSYRLKQGDAHQQLILISLDPNEKIEKGDSMLHPLDKEITIWDGDESITKNPTEYKYRKVIAQQSQLSPEYIQQFIEEYNRGEVNDIEIEMEVCGTVDSTCGLFRHVDTSGEYFYMGRRPMLTNGFITIVNKEPKCINDLVNICYDKIKGEHSEPFVKTMLTRFALDVIKLETKEPVLYTEEEVWNLLATNSNIYLDWFNNALNGNFSNKPDLLKWFEQNKKK